jgi:hypothetical protein
MAISDPMRKLAIRCNAGKSGAVHGRCRPDGV